MSGFRLNRRLLSEWQENRQAQVSERPCFKTSIDRAEPAVRLDSCIDFSLEQGHGRPAEAVGIFERSFGSFEEIVLVLDLLDFAPAVSRRHVPTRAIFENELGQGFKSTGRVGEVLFASGATYGLLSGNTLGWMLLFLD